MTPPGPTVAPRPFSAILAGRRARDPAGAGAEAMTDSGRSAVMVWIVSDDADQGDACIRGVYERAEAAYAAADELERQLVEPSTIRVLAHEVKR